MTDGSPPGGFLDDITVLDLSTVGPASRATRWLADYGAGVVRVLPPGGGLRPPFHAYSANRGISSLTLDLRAEGGREAFLRLAERADVVVESFRPGVVDRLGIGYATVSARNPRIIYCSTTGFGQAGPRSQWAGHDLGYLAAGGYLHHSGRGPDGTPVHPGASIADGASGGMHAVMAVLAALHARDRGGTGCHLDVAITDGVLALMSLAVDEYLVTGEPPEPGGTLLNGRYACYDIYRTRDDGFVAVAAIEPRFWENLCRALDLPRWIDRQFDDEAQPAVRADLGAAFRTRDRDDWVGALSGHDTCVAPVLSVAEVADDMAASGRTLAAEHPVHGSFRQLPPLLAGMRRPAEPVPAGTDAARDVLSGAGFSPTDIDRLIKDGIVC